MFEELKNWLKNFSSPEVPVAPVPQQWELPVFDDEDEEAPMGLSAYKYTSSDGVLWQVHQSTSTPAPNKIHRIDDTKAHNRGYTHV